MDRTLFYQIRLPRTFLVILGGGALALAGLVYQSVFQNPLVSPDVLGVSSGSSIGAILGLLFLNGASYPTGFLAFFFGMGTVLLAMGLAGVMGGNRRYSMIISGILIGSLADSVIMVLKYTADPNRELASIEYWLMGSFQHADWQQILGILPLLLIPGAFLYLLRWKMKVLGLGDEEAGSLGISPGFVRVAALICATVLVAAVVSVAGVVAWIGLIAPHLVRMLGGEDYVKNFGSCVCMGSILLLAADVCARTLFTAEIPISIFTSFFGAVTLFVFLLKRRGSHGA